VAVEVEAGTGTPLRRRLAEGDLLGIPVEEVEALAGAPQLEVTHVSDAPVPLAVSERTRFILFRETHGFFQHVAILIGDRNEWPDPVPVRLHSACLTGDLFRSLRCDCGEQLQMSLELMTEQGGGVLLYLEQEGRGIGLGNKLRAYSLQEEGLDTVDADGALGFGADERRYDSAVEILRRLEVGRIRLLTNNPAKVAAVREGGIDVVDRQPLHGTLNRHNLPYVRAKVRRAGHWLEDMLAEALPPE
jgi:GTP cyclohydrolase II